MKIAHNTLTVSDTTIPIESAKASGLINEEDKLRFKTRQFRAVSSTKGTNINDVNATFDLLTDLRYAADIIVSELLSPKDLLPPKMNIVLDTEGTDVDISKSKIVDMLNRHFGKNGYYDLESKMYDFVFQSLVTTGSKPLLVLKKNEIDSFINDNMNGNWSLSRENLKQASVIDTVNENVLVAKSENLSNIDIKVTNNVNILKKAVFDNYDTEIMYKELGMENARPGHLSFVNTNRMEENQAGFPLVWELPSESVINIFPPGQPDKHMGHFIVLEGGYPITHKKDSAEMERLERRMKDILKGTSDTFKNFVTVSNEADRKEAKELDAKDYMKAYVDKVRDELKQALKHGAFKKELDVSAHEDVYRLMFHLSLNKKSIEVIYVPAGMLTYWAYDYDENGMGLSLMEKTKMFSTIRSAVLIANIFGAVKNSVPQTNVSVTIDEEDDDPYQTLEIIKDKVSKMTGAMLPIGVSRPSDIMDALQKASINMTVEGGNAFPNTRAEIIDGSRQVVTANPELDEMLKKMHLSGFGTSPEKVDRALEGDYAISTATTNDLDVKRTLVKQATTERFVSAFIRNYVRLSKPFIDEIKKIDTDIDKVIRCINFKLPSPEGSRMQQMLDSYSNAVQLIEAMVEDQINENMLRDTMQGQYATNAIDNVREMLRGYYLAEWMRDENIMTQILDISSKDNKELVEKLSEKMGNTVDLINEVMAAVIKVEKKGAKNLREQVDKFVEDTEQAEQEGDLISTPGEEDSDIFEEETSRTNEGNTEEDATDDTVDDQAAGGNNDDLIEPIEN